MTFRAADWVVLALYLALLVWTGWLFSRRESQTTHEYFLGGRRMPMWAVSVSIIATSLSAATFVGAPEQSYKNDLTYLSTNIGGLISIFIVAYVFIPAFYKNNCTTIYELLESRFGTSSKHATSAAFMIGRLFASGARIYIGAIPLSMILFGADVADSPNYVLLMVCSIAALAVVGTFYTLFGGISSVIWTDVIQTVVLIIAVIAAIVVLLIKIDLPIESIIYQLSGQQDRMLPGGGVDKLNLIDVGLDTSKPYWGFDPSAQFTLLTAVLGFSLLNVAAYGTDHDMVQRMLTCKNAIQGGRSVLLSMAIGIPMVLAFLVVGLLLWVFYKEALQHAATAAQELQKAQDLVRQNPPQGDVIEIAVSPPFSGPMPDSKQVFVGFIVKEMPAGLAGLMLAGLFAAGVGSLTSAINAMSATTIKDFYQRWVPNRGDKHYLAAGRWAVIGWGVALATFAVICLFWQRASPGTTLIGLALSVMTFAYAGLLAVFVTALFTKRGNTRSVIAALITGFVVIALLQDWVWPHWVKFVPVVGEDLSKIRLAFPWHMTIGSGLAFIVCVFGKPEPAKRRATEGSVPHCLSCDYSMVGGGSTCPECGHAVEAKK